METLNTIESVSIIYVLCKNINKRDNKNILTINNFNVYKHG